MALHSIRGGVGSDCRGLLVAAGDTYAANGERREMGKARNDGIHARYRTQRHRWLRGNCRCKKWLKRGTPCKYSGNRTNVRGVKHSL